MPFDVYLQRPNLVSLYNSRPGQKKLRPGPPEVACLTLNVWSDGRSGRTSGAARTWLLPNQMTGALVGVAKASLYFSPVTSSQSLGTNVWLILFSIVRKCKTSRVALEEALWPLLNKKAVPSAALISIPAGWKWIVRIASSAFIGTAVVGTGIVRIRWISSSPSHLIVASLSLLTRIFLPSICSALRYSSSIWKPSCGGYFLAYAIQYSLKAITLSERFEAFGP